MATIERSALVPYSADQMFLLVNRVDQYPGFLRWCSDGSVRDETELGMQASITIKIGRVFKTFTTRNVIERPHRISLNLVDGPFRQLSGAWTFQPLGEEGSKVSLFLEFEFASRVLSTAFTSGFSLVAERLVSDFCDQAEQVYDVS
jgi:ribosome-associated toxin RatA of RatAB toxin-antitoxin module